MRATILILLSGLTVATALGFTWVQRESPRLERRVLVRAQESLRANPAEWVKLDVDGRDLKVSGRYPSRAERDRVLGLLGGVPGVRMIVDATAPGQGIDGDLVVADDPGSGDCQKRLDTLLSREAIRFEVLSAAISPASKPLLQELAATLREFPHTRVEIAGHTDSEGIADLNKKLSEARAESIRNFLIHQGIAAERLVAVGYGSSRPIADDSNEEGRKKNRRIEFKVRGIDS